MSQSLQEKVLSYLTEQKEATAKDIADALGVEKKQVNSLLYGTLNYAVIQDSSYTWRLKVNKPDTSPVQQSVSNVPISRITRYYLACLSHDDVGVSTFAHSKYGDPEYVELASLPQSPAEFQNLAEVQKIAGRVRKDRSRLGVFFGYPSVLGLVKSKKSSWQGFMVEPIFVFPIQDADNGQLVPDFSFPTLNHKCVRRFTNAAASELMEQVVLLEEELGLSDTSTTPDLDELVLRLRSIRPEWPWVEEPMPDELPQAPRLAEANREGIYNRAVLMLAERSPFTKGLEGELSQLGKVREGELENTALGQWIAGSAHLVPNIGADEEPLLEVLPMNTEQRSAVSSALTSPLTVITGPPGTGKSQVVANLLINAAWKGQKVLFASKNNKAVDVVETRVNALGPRPVLLRVGSNQYQNKLAEYLVALLGATASVEDRECYQESLERHKMLLDRYEELNKHSEDLIATRNAVDQLDRQLSGPRDNWEEGLIASFRELDVSAVEQAIKEFIAAVRGAIYAEQRVLDQLLWRWMHKARLKILRETAHNLERTAASLGLVLPTEDVSLDSLQQWNKFGTVLEDRLSQVLLIREYFQQLENLQGMRTLEELSGDQAKVTAAMADNATKLWNSWLRLQPDRLRASDRQLLNKYSAILKMMIDGTSNERDARKVASQYRSLLSKVNHLLSCWAVTSLSAKGKLPFIPGYFDLVVFDESSQCDIASALPLLYRAKRAVIIGDPKQLSHISGMRKGQDQQLLEKFGLTEDYPHWAYSYNSLFDLATGQVAGSGIVSLRDHHRCHSDIIEFSNTQFYEGTLRVATRHGGLKRPRTDEPGVKWVDVRGATVRPPTGGAENAPEANAVATVLRRLVLERGYEGSVGVVSPFRAQANLIRSLVNDDSELLERLIRSEFLVDTVHKFQGDERDVMIFSPVISVNSPRSAFGFLSNNGNLFNVAITRARGQLIVVGDRAACAACEISYLSQFAQYSQALETRSRQASEATVSSLGPKYPEVANPEQVSDWERFFYKAIYSAGIRAIPQYRVEKYVLDFAIIDGDRRLDIEIDGERYHRNWTGELCRRDQMRNQRLFELGWDVQRFWVYEVRDDLAACIDRVRDWLTDDEAKVA